MEYILAKWLTGIEIMTFILCFIHFSGEWLDSIYIRTILK